MSQHPAAITTPPVRQRVIYLYGENYHYQALEPLNSKSPGWHLRATITLTSDGFNHYLPDGRQFHLLTRIPGSTQIRAVVYGDGPAPRPILADFAFDVDIQEV